MSMIEDIASRAKSVARVLRSAGPELFRFGFRRFARSKRALVPWGAKVVRGQISARLIFRRL